MKTTEDRPTISIPGKPVALEFRYPSIRETRRIESDFEKPGDVAGYTAAINRILTGWTGSPEMYTGNVEDVLSEIDVLFLRNSLLHDLALQEIEHKKVFLSGVAKPGHLDSTPNESTKPTPSPSNAPIVGEVVATDATKGNG